MSSPLIIYAFRMARLRRIIFGELVRPTPLKNLKIEKLFARRAWEEKLNDYYPPINKFNDLLWKLREKGLYYDDHWDYRDWRLAEREKLGKIIRKKGQGKRQILKQQEKT